MHRILLALLASMALSAVACAGPSDPPSPDRMAGEVSRLDAVIPILEELGVTDFENSAFCRNLAYVRGTFGVLEEDGCMRDGTRPFDAIALDDHARLAQAVVAAGVASHRIRLASFDVEGNLESVWFSLIDASIEHDWAYLYDPADAVHKTDVPGRVDFTPIANDWWFVESFDD